MTVLTDFYVVNGENEDQNCTDRRNNICANHKGIWCNAEYGRVINKKVKGCKSYVRKESEDD